MTIKKLKFTTLGFHNNISEFKAVCFYAGTDAHFSTNDYFTVLTDILLRN